MDQPLKFLVNADIHFPRIEKTDKYNVIVLAKNKTEARETAELYFTYCINQMLNPDCQGYYFDNFDINPLCKITQIRPDTYPNDFVLI